MRSYAIARIVDKLMKIANENRKYQKFNKIALKFIFDHLQFKSHKIPIDSIIFTVSVPSMAIAKLFKNSWKLNRGEATLWSVAKCEM